MKERRKYLQGDRVTDSLGGKGDTRGTQPGTCCVRMGIHRPSRNVRANGLRGDAVNEPGWNIARAACAQAARRAPNVDTAQARTFCKRSTSYDPDAVSLDPTRRGSLARSADPSLSMACLRHRLSFELQPTRGHPPFAAHLAVNRDRGRPRLAHAGPACALKRRLPVSKKCIDRKTLIF